MGVAEPGDMVAGRYKLRAVLGRGGMGSVWLADDELLHREVAVKETLWPPQLDEKERETLRQRALREARTAARLDHPNIIRMYDVVEEDGRPWIVMQLARYRSLSEVVREDGPLSPARAAHIGLQLLAAIRAAHAAGVLHRDVKPGNVLLGPEDRVVLTDFGMAVADGNPTLTTSGILIGSPPYMAPERARGGPGTPAADLWSLGATLYMAVEGRPPFQREGAMAVLTAIVSTEPDPPVRAGPLWLVIKGLLRKNPAERLDAARAEGMLRRIASPGLASPIMLEEPTAPLADAAPPAPAQAAGGYFAATPEPGTRPQPPAAMAGGPGRDMVDGPGRDMMDGPGREPVLIPGLKPRPDAATGEPWRSAGRHPRLRWLLAAAAGLAVAAAVAMGLTLAPDHGPASAGGRGMTGGHGTSPATSPGSNPTAGPLRSGGGEPAALPAGFVRYHDSTGFSIGVPSGWQVSHRGHLVYIQDPASSRFLIIDQTTSPKPNALADWRQQEAARMGTLPGYHRIRLEAVHYPQAEQAADWEFTFYQNGQLTHVLNRNILVNSHHAYALYWSTPASQWATSYHMFQVFAATFRPAGFARGS